MEDLHKRMLLFLIGCMGVRFLLVYIVKTVHKTKLQYMGYLALLPAIGFIYIFFTGSRKKGNEVFGDKIWWNMLRPIHALLYLLFAYNAITKNSEAWIYLLYDVVLGLISFLTFHFYSGNFALLFT